ncbi:hypothetical protein MYA_2750 [Burkholderia sp. KJ006]|nr:hypothetical protein MYA_2750 [Burkholderia sp. KJ006]
MHGIHHSFFTDCRHERPRTRRATRLADERLVPDGTGRAVRAGGRTVRLFRRARVQYARAPP